ncbi:MAG TPA: hypothetical protein VG013_43450 [Gemmataceae bacterium]|jgi:hypothetical protein|nr:hypothetical protein [Gemmataceae bacterium]
MVGYWINLLADPVVLVPALFAVPLALFVLLLGAVMRPAKERQFEEELASRPALEDNAFYDMFYRQTAVPKDIVVRLRKLYAEQLGAAWHKVCPQDNAAEVYDLDFAEPLYEVEEAFGVKFPLDNWRIEYCTFDAVARYLANHQMSTS